MNKHYFDQRGAVALITAMIVSILLMITTAGMVSVTLKSLRGSTDGAQSTKAYYAAEGGLEEALRQIKEGTYTDSCGGADAASSAKTGVVTCVKVTTTANELTGTIGADETVQLDLSSVTNLRSLKLEWGMPEGVAYNSASIPNYINNFPGKQDSSAATKWSATAPAVMEIGIVQYPASPTFSITQVDFNQATIAPRSNTPGDPSYTINAPSLYSNTQTYDDPIVAKCNQPAPYQCAVGAGGLVSGNHYVVRLRTRYNGARYRLIAQDGSNVAIPIPAATYNIDVTARAGDVFRRIQTSFPLGATTPAAARGLDYVLYSDTDICKSFQVANKITDLSSGLSCLPN